jgi:hypothetical protein
MQDKNGVTKKPTLEELFAEDLKDPTIQQLREKHGKEVFDRYRKQILKKHYIDPPLTPTEERIEFLEDYIYEMEEDDDHGHDWVYDKPGSEVYDYGNSLGKDPNHCSECLSYNECKAELKELKGDTGVCSVM